MELLLSARDRFYHYARFLPGEEPAVAAVPQFGEPYVCLLWDAVGAATDGERAAFARALLDSGCRYFLAAGEDSAAWHDAVDLVGAEREAVEEAPTDGWPHVMTTWHEDDPVEEVAWFFVWNTDFADPPFQHFVALQRGVAGGIERELRAAVREQAEAVGGG